MSSIRIRGAAEHNLKNVSLEIPRDALTVLTGVSGSGKSSLAFDTIYKEGQRRFLESLPAYARQFLGSLEKPKVEAIDGLSPAVSIEQKTVARSPRSTVGTITEIHDYLRLLYARLGQPHCPRCGKRVASQSAEQICDRVLSLWSGRTAFLTAPVVRDRKGEHREVLENLRRDGFRRLRIDGAFVELDDAELPALERRQRHGIEVVLDRVAVRPEARGRLTESIEKCLALAGGLVGVEEAPAGDEGATPAGGGGEDAKAPRRAAPELFSSRFACPGCGVDLPEISPRLFSFNSHLGACEACGGLGEAEQPDPDLVVADPSLPFRRGGLAVMLPSGELADDDLDPEGFARLARLHGFSASSSWGDLSPEARAALLDGDGQYEGLLPALGRLARRDDAAWVIKYLRHRPCAVCSGTRLSPVARAVTFRGRGIHELAALPLVELRQWLERLDLAGSERLIGEPILRDVLFRLAYLEKVGLGYLTLERRASTLAGGEAQRLRLASQVGGRLQGILYVLDEPSIGLHSHDQKRLLDTLAALRDQGNTVMVVEHDRATMEAADHLVDVGPGAGPKGGEIVAQGGRADLEREPRSLTGRYLAGERSIPLPRARRAPADRWLEVNGASHNNLKNIDARVPLGLFTVVTGVSGSGKSSLVNGVLRPALLQKLGWRRLPAGKHRSLRGAAELDKVVTIDQSPIGRSPRSNPATYVKVFDLVRQLFAQVPEARARGYRAGRFSFNLEGGRCMECRGAGVTVVEMQLLAAVEVTCDACGGRRYNRETLEIRYRGRGIDEVLEMPVGEAVEFFRDHPKMRRTLEWLDKVGLGYMRLGQPSTTLSGGEAQRVKLAAELCRQDTGRTLYLLDEPTTGLHFEDIRSLLDALQELVGRGNTVLMIEHNLDVIKVADHVIDLGPGAGAEGGRIVARGTPEEVSRVPGSLTGEALGAVLMEASAREGPRAKSSPRAREPADAGNGAALRGGAGGPEKGDIVVRGARQHNLQGIDVRIPHRSLTVVTGVSGSGKSSLAIDTLFAEGQRRYIEALSTYARRFLGRAGGADVDAIAGLAPAIAIDQKSVVSNPRSTVATITEIHDYLRLLYARVGTPHCPRCRGPLAWASPSRLAADLVRRERGKKAYVLAPVELTELRGADGELVASGASVASGRLLREIENVRVNLLKGGYTRALAGGVEVRLDDDGPEALRALLAGLRAGAGAGASRNGHLDVVVDRVALEESVQTRLADSLHQAFERGGGRAGVCLAGEAPTFHSRFPACPAGHFEFGEELTPRMFSFSSHQGACERCRGLGVEKRADPDLVVRRPELPLLEALDPAFRRFLQGRRPGAYKVLLAFSAARGIEVGRTAVLELSGGDRQALLHGTGDEKFSLPVRGGLEVEATWPGLLPLLEEAIVPERTAPEDPSLLRLLRPRTCSVCDGGRLRPEILEVRLGGPGSAAGGGTEADRAAERGLNIREFAAMTVARALAFVRRLVFPPREARIARDVLVEITNRLEFLGGVGLDYLELDRSASTLSGGEAQRIRLASQLGNRLAGVLYVLDEPTIGLHQRDTERLLSCLRGLRDLGNTVVVVEHDRETILAADWVVELGPGAGRGGGRVMACGPPAAVVAAPGSLTGRYLRGEERVAAGGGAGGAGRRQPQGWIELEGINHHNLRSLDAAFPLGVLTAVSGVSGSGKSTLVVDVLAEALDAFLAGRPGPPDRLRAARGLDSLRRLVVVDHKPIGNSPRSSPATYTGLWTLVRELYAELPLSRLRGWDAERFSFNTGEGRCRACDGQGAIEVEMDFLSDVWIPCTECRGLRFDRETLGARFKGLSVGDLLRLEVDAAIDFFANQPRALAIVETLQAVGLGYLKLGQAANTLSGGEAQRLKLARELAGGGDGGGTLYILDEPTTGLHFEDVRKLLEVLRALVLRGNTMVAIEHHLDVIGSADWVIDLGPEAGADGGRIVAAGAPEDIEASAASHTGRCLRQGHSLPSRRELPVP